jgi:hypothetical protein
MDVGICNRLSVPPLGFGPSHTQLGLLGPPYTLDQPLYWACTVAYTVYTFVLLPFHCTTPLHFKPFLGVGTKFIVGPMGRRYYFHLKNIISFDILNYFKPF